MQYTLFKPSFLLRNFIRFYWTFETDCDNGSTFLHESVASASSKLVFQYRGDMGLTGSPSGSRTGMVASIQAQTRHASTFISAGPVGIFGVYFYPGALSLLLSMPAHELNNQNILLASMKGISADQLEEDVILATSTIERIDIVNAFFEARLAGISKPDLQIFTSIQAIATSHGQLTISQLVDRYYLSQRQLERKFKTVSGFSPKTLSRIVRFENSIQSFLDNPSSLTSTAYATGYFDQSHFIRDFKEFSGKSPANYFLQDLEIFRNM